MAGFQVDDLLFSPDSSPLRPKPPALLRHGNPASKTGNGATYSIYRDEEAGSATTPQRRCNNSARPTIACNVDHTATFGNFTYHLLSIACCAGYTFQYPSAHAHPVIASSRADGVLTLEEFSPAPWIDFGHVVVGEGKVWAWDRMARVRTVTSRGTCSRLTWGLRSTHAPSLCATPPGGVCPWPFRACPSQRSSA